MVHHDAQRSGGQETISLQPRRREGFQDEHRLDEECLVIFIRPNAKAAVTLLAAEQQIHRAGDHWMIAGEQAHIFATQGMASGKGAHEAFIGNFRKRICGDAMTLQNIGARTNVFDLHSKMIKHT